MEFPRCSKCTEGVAFEVVFLAPRLNSIREPIILHQLPEVDDSAA